MHLLKSFHNDTLCVAGGGGVRQGGVAAGRGGVRQGGVAAGRLRSQIHIQNNIKGLKLYLYVHSCVCLCYKTFMR